MPTNAFKNVLPPGTATTDVPAAMEALAASIGQYVEVESRNEANQLRAEQGVGTGTFTVFRKDLPNGGAFETHPNTGSPGEGWTQQTNRQLLASDINATQGNLQTILSNLLGELAGLPAFAWGVATNDVIGSKPTVYDTGSISYESGIRVNFPLKGTPRVFVADYIATNGIVVQTSVPVVNTDGFTIRIKRNGYGDAAPHAGAVNFPWFAIGPSS